MSGTLKRMIAGALIATSLGVGIAATSLPAEARNVCKVHGRWIAGCAPHVRAHTEGFFIPHPLLFDAPPETRGCTFRYIDYQIYEYCGPYVPY
jgi:hypothetical protein